MSESTRTKSPGIGRFAVAIISLVALWTFTMPINAEAALVSGSAGNTIIRNAGTLTYSNAAGVGQANRYFGVDVTVSTVAAAPTVTITPSPGSTESTGGTQLYTATIRTNSNGLGTFGTTTLTDQNPLNIATSATVPTAIASFTLGATSFDPSNTFGATGAFTSGVTTITIRVPNDGTGVSTTSINGLTTAGGGSTVYITDGTNYYGPFKVTAVSQAAVPALSTAAAIVAVPYSTITLTANANFATFNTTAGMMIVEQVAKTFLVTQGIVADPTSAASWDTKVDVSMTTGLTAPQLGTATVTTNAHQLDVTVKKYSRNTGSVCSTGNTLTFNAIVYCDAGVTGKPTDTLEYLIVVSNTGTGNATVVKASDVVPTYTSIVLATGKFATIYDNALASVAVDNTTGSATIGYGVLTGTAMAFDLGNPSTLGAGGTIPTASKWYVRYQVTVN